MKNETTGKWRVKSVYSKINSTVSAMQQKCTCTKRDQRERVGMWKSLESKVFFFFPHPYPLALAVNKSPAVYIYHERSKDFEEKIGGLWTGYQGFKGTVTPYAHVRHLYFWSGGTFFQDWQTDQLWRLMWSSGFHLGLSSSPLNDLPFSVRLKR